MTPRNILIVDDEREYAERLALLIEKGIHKRDKAIEVKFTFAATLAEGLSLRQSSNATILDLGLPETSITEVIEAIPLFPEPVVILTGYDDPVTTAQCYAKGVASVFSKPIADLEDFLNQILDCFIRDFVKKRPHLTSHGA